MKTLLLISSVAALAALGAAKANQDKKIIQAIDVVFKKYRAENGIKVK